MSGKLENKVAVITGGAGGIGKEAGRLFAAEGANVLLVDLDEAALTLACDEIGSNRVSDFAADVTRFQDNEEMVSTAIERYGGVDVLVANAGIEGEVRSIVDYDERMFDSVMAVNLKGPFLGLKAAIPAIEKRGGGSIIITSSVAGLRGGPNFSAYTASKHGVIGLMRSAALECASNEDQGEYGESFTCGNANDAQHRTRLGTGGGRRCQATAIGIDSCWSLRRIH